MISDRRRAGRIYSASSSVKNFDLKMETCVKKTGLTCRNFENEMNIETVRNPYYLGHDTHSEYENQFSRKERIENDIQNRKILRRGSSCGKIVRKG